MSCWLQNNWRKNKCYEKEENTPHFLLFINSVNDFLHSWVTLTLKAAISITIHHLLCEQGYCFFFHLKTIFSQVNNPIKNIFDQWKVKGKVRWRELTCGWQLTSLGSPWVAQRVCARPETINVKPQRVM